MTRRRAVIIDDEVPVATVLKDILGHCGVEVAALAHDYETGAALLDGEPTCDVAFIDLRLDGALSGVELTRRAVARGIHVVVVTGSDRLPTDLQGPALLTKPFSREAVQMVLESFGERPCHRSKGRS